MYLERERHQQKLGHQQLIETRENDNNNKLKKELSAFFMFKREREC